MHAITKIGIALIVLTAASGCGRTRKATQPTHAPVPAAPAPQPEAPTVWDWLGQWGGQPQIAPEPVGNEVYVNGARLSPDTLRALETGYNTRIGAVRYWYDRRAGHG